MRNLWLDVRSAPRRLRNASGLALTALFTLACGIGAITSFSLGERLRQLLLGSAARLGLVGCAASFIPALAAVSMSPVKAFRSE